MTATNHALTGAAIALIIGQPLIALPAALLSHFVCDALPHFDSSLPSDDWLASRNFKILLVVDAWLCVILVAVLAIFQPQHWLLAAVCAFLATSPDLLWINRFWRVKTNRPWQPNLFSRFAAKIQWFTAPIGAVVEATWFCAGIVVLSFYIR